MSGTLVLTSHQCGSGRSWSDVVFFYSTMFKAWKTGHFDGQDIRLAALDPTLYVSILSKLQKRHTQTTNPKILSYTECSDGLP